MWHGGVGQAWQEEVTTFYSEEVLSALMVRLDSRTTRIARELNVEQLDLMPILEPGVKTYYDFFHATPAGASVIAAAVGAALIQRPAATASPESAADYDGSELEHRAAYLKVS